VSKTPRSHRTDENAPDGADVILPDLGPAGAAADRVVDLRSTETPARLRHLGTIQTASDVLCLAVTVWAFGLFGGIEARSAVLLALIAATTWAVVFRSFSLDALLHFPLLEEVRRIFSATSVATLVVVVLLGTWERNLTGVRLGWVWLTVLALELVTRRGLRAYAGRLRARGELSLRTIVVGANDEALSLVRGAVTPSQGHLPIGFIRTVSPIAASRLPAPVLGEVSDLEDVLRDNDVACVFVAASAITARDLLRVARACRHRHLELRVSANLPPVISSRLVAKRVGKTSALSVRPPQFARAQRAAKRALDIVLSAIGLVVGAPLMAVIAASIRATSSGPALFKQERVTRGGRTFTVFKFRTMVPRRASDPRLIDLTQPFFKLEDDPRLTGVGRFLRKSSLDELPQLWNVIRGDMSLVGPRPLPVEQVRANTEMLAARHEVRAGMTGWWQVNGRSDIDVDQALDMDLFYIENWSLGMDLHILVETVGAVFARKGAK
jgi:exopolysaccharide biosynthesis polyprenyl glycosylphosphotransferase